MSKVERWKVEWQATKATKQFMEESKRVFEGNQFGGSTSTHYVRTFGNEENAQFFMRMLQAGYSCYPKIEKWTIEK